jgi:hypothetical protein
MQVSTNILSHKYLCNIVIPARGLVEKARIAILTNLNIISRRGELHSPQLIAGMISNSIFMT